MAKKKTKVEVEETPQAVETQVVETPKLKKVEPAKPKWELRDRVYYLKGNLKPLSKMIRSSNIFYLYEDVYLIIFAILFFLFLQTKHHF